MSEETKKFNLTSSGRVDKVIATHLSDLSRNQISHLINCGSILIDGVVMTKASKHVKEGSLAEVNEMVLKPTELKAQDLKLNVVFEDKYLVIVEKQNGMVVHPAPGNADGTMVNGLMHQIKDFNAINGTLRPGVVHRLDKFTSGLMVFAKNQKTTAALAEMFKDRNIKREYIALARGNFAHKRGHIDAPIGRSEADRKKMAVTAKHSKQAITDFVVLNQYEDFAVIKCVLKTGRTHQIRVHLDYIGHKILGDPVYGLKREKNNEYGQYLHAKTLGFTHPDTNEELLFESELPQEFCTIIEKKRYEDDK